MPVCTKCGTWNQDAAKSCDKCGAKISPAAAAAAPLASGAGPVTPPPSPLTPAPIASGAGVAAAGTADLLDRRGRKFFQLAALLIVSLVGGVLLAKSSNGSYDSSAQCTLDSNYTVETTTRNGSVESVKYKVTYAFDANGQHYTGKDTLDAEPTVPEVTVFFMARNPNENALKPTRSILPNLIATVVAFLISIVAYWMLPKNYPFAAGGSRAAAAGVGDSGNETARMKRGKYSAWLHVHIAFFAQVGLVALLAAFVAAAVAHAEATSYAILGAATFVAIATTIWVYADRWRCIEVFSSRACSGVANLSILYVPVVAFIYANYRGLKKLQGK